MIDSVAHGIYLNLNLRTPTPDKPGEFHWLLWFAQQDDDVGIKVHATNSGGAFVMEAKSWHGPKSMSAAAFLRIGSLDVGQNLDEILEVLGKIPMESPEEDNDTPFTCRIWVREAVRVLSKRGVLKCESVDKLEDEAIKVGKKSKEAVELGTGKAGIFDSKYSK